MSPWKGDAPRVYDLTCDDTICPPDSFCLSDYDGGGSRCHCNLGWRGNTCSEGERPVTAWALHLPLTHPNYGTLESLTSSSCPFSVVQVNFPRFYGYSHMTFEPLKNSYQTFQITVEFKVCLSHPFVAKEEQEFFGFFCKLVFCTGWKWGRLVVVLRREWTRSWRLHLTGSGAREVALQVNHMGLMDRRLKMSLF